MFIYPALTLLYPVCYFAWQSLQAIHRGTRLHDLWQRLSLIHKSQKDQFKIHEQSVLLQPEISVTVGQWRHGATERKSSASPHFTGRHTGTGTHAVMLAHTLMHGKAKGEKEVLMGVLKIALLMQGLDLTNKNKNRFSNINLKTGKLLMKLCINLFSVFFWRE